MSLEKTDKEKPSSLLTRLLKKTAAFLSRWLLLLRNSRLSQGRFSVLLSLILMPH